MSVFETAVNDIFKSKDFLEICTIDGVVYACICSALDEAHTYSDAGLVSDVSFMLSIRLPLFKEVKVGAKVKFRDKDYKVSNLDTDSANTSVHIYLESTSKGS